jgi:ubiquinone/menaquinone biosynthesis C-methylase UbiE
MVRLDYDAIAHFYDSQPYRTKTVDPELLAFIEQRIPGDPAFILDLGCGTGNQLIANRPVLPSARLVGLDRSLGMLRQARPKAPDIAWVQADASALPFQTESFDFITCQFALHHIRDKVGMLRETPRVLKIGGRLILRNLCPQECADWLYYDYFPEARTIDLEDFWPQRPLWRRCMQPALLP